MTQEYKNPRSNEYATGGDFCRIYLEQMNNLYLLALLLTADPQKAEQCFLSGFHDSVSSNSVFKDRTYLWARRSIILHAIQLLCPRQNHERQSNETRLSIGEISAELRAYPNLVGIVRLNPFERFVFIMSILEKYSDQECSLLLGCLRGDVISARSAALRHLASLVVPTETQPMSDLTLKSTVAEAAL